MNAQQQRLFEDNIGWFNTFFENIKAIFDRIAEAIPTSAGLGEPKFYYPKYNSRPSIPQYCAMGMDGEPFSLQVLAVFDRQLLEGNADLQQKPSLALVRLQDPQQNLWFDKFSLAILSGNAAAQQNVDTVLKGNLGPPTDCAFDAIQIPFGAFAGENDLDGVVQSLIVPYLRSDTGF